MDNQFKTIHEYGHELYFDYDLGHHHPNPHPEIPTLQCASPVTLQNSATELPAYVAYAVSSSVLNESVVKLLITWLT